MGRSAKEYCRPGQSVDGGGLVRPDAMGAGAGVKPSDEGATEGSGLTKAKARQAAKAGVSKGGKQQSAHQKSSIEEGDSGWDKIGKAGADIVTTYNERKQERQAAEAAKKNKQVAPPT